jgi:hypothetical protein
VDDNEQPIRAPIYIGEQCVRGVQNAAMLIDCPRPAALDHLESTQHDAGPVSVG